jgi:hypothetical protein
MGKLPALGILVIALWLAWTVYRDGPDEAFGGLGALISSPQYGEADRPTRSGTLADEILDEGNSQEAK